MKRKTVFEDRFTFPLGAFQTALGSLQINKLKVYLTKNLEVVLNGFPSFVLYCVCATCRTGLLWFETTSATLQGEIEYQRSQCLFLQFIQDLSPSQGH